MPRTRQTKEWTPDASSQQIIDEMARYTVVAERCSLHLRSLDSKEVKHAWDRAQKAWNMSSKNDPTDPVISSSQDSDLMARERFRRSALAV
ncbi:hypothetical protein EW146_g8780 [Bondarzewia mesenterica]|uniref:Uncharacterized protein n=1 Tax=Bondarzewia mesenterica TaxID=1095465 RepID=A0A4S4LC56_9AGAM|nr:hypothetical protein EW146_g8780 [Bondarzewia mesenterica]